MVGADFWEGEENMEWIKPGTKIDFIGKRYYCFVLSSFLILAGTISMVLRGGPNYGVDFSGGLLVQLRSDKAVPIGQLRDSLSKIGWAKAQIQQFGEAQEVLIRAPQSSEAPEAMKDRLIQAIHESFPQNSWEERRTETVGPQVSKELQKKAIIALTLSFAAMYAYVTYRFGWLWATGGILALIHDVWVTIGFFSLTDKEITLPVVAALLTIIGYSINDSIVVFDRIRENLKKLSRNTALARVINISVNETLSRTILTSFTVLITVLALFFLGGEVIHDFAFAVIIGVISGTYSTIYIASSALLLWPAKGTKKKK
jgi:preprotein translocase subunit SecF